jgi:hypothetical protein
MHSLTPFQSNCACFFPVVITSRKHVLFTDLIRELEYQAPLSLLKQMSQYIGMLLNVISIADKILRSLAQV